MKFVKKLEVDEDFFAPRYLATHTQGFRRMTAENFFIEDVAYHLWSFVSKRIPIGCALIPPTRADHMLVFSLEKTEKIIHAPFRINNYLQVNETSISKLIPGQSLYVKIDDWDKNFIK